MPQLFTNNARATLVTGIAAGDTTMTIEAGKADLFPSANVGTGTVPSISNWFKATLQDSLGNVEIVYVRSRSLGSGVLSNVLRGQEGTTARVFTSGTVVGLRITAADIEASIGLKENANSWTAIQTFLQTIVGSITGNAETVTNGVYTSGDQSIAGNKTFTGSTVAAGGLRVGSGDSSSLVMTDSNEGDRTLHCNSNNIGFLTQAGGWGAWCDDSGNWTAAQNVTAFSDERLKKDWAALPDDFLERLAKVLYGTYTRIDSETRQAGASAQDFERLLPEVVMKNSDGVLSLAYGNAALVSVIKLTERVLELEARLSALEK